MRGGKGGLKALAPSPELLNDFMAAKQAALREGSDREAAHMEAFRRTKYRDRFLSQIKSDPAAREALGRLIEEARDRDVYLMCMCPARTPGRACHTYLLLELAQARDAGVRLLKEPAPSRGPRRS